MRTLLFFIRRCLEVEAQRCRGKDIACPFPVSESFCGASSYAPRGQQCVFDQAPGVLPVRRETIEGIDGGRMQCGIRLVCNAARGARLRHVETVIWLLDAMRASGLCAMGARLRPGSSYSMRGWLCTEPFGRQLRLGPGGNIACHRCRQVMVCTVPLRHQLRLGSCVSARRAKKTPAQGAGHLPRSVQTGVQLIPAKRRPRSFSGSLPGQ